MEDLPLARRQWPGTGGRSFAWGMDSLLVDLRMDLSSPSGHGGKSSKCNTFGEENFSRRTPAKTLSGAVVDKIDDLVHTFLRNGKEIKPLWEEEAKQVVRVFICAALSGLVWFSEID